MAGGGPSSRPVLLTAARHCRGNGWVALLVVRIRPRQGNRHSCCPGIPETPLHGPRGGHGGLVASHDSDCSRATEGGINMGMDLPRTLVVSVVRPRHRNVSCARLPGARSLQHSVRSRARSTTCPAQAGQVVPRRSSDE